MAKKKYSPLGRLIHTELFPPLQELVAFVTRGPKGLSELQREVVGVLEAAVKIQYPVISTDAAERFNRFAEQASVQFHLGHPAPNRINLQVKRHVAASLLMPSGWSGDNDGARGLWAYHLFYGFFLNPERARLRCCTQCARWYFDDTRNKSKRRCSRACTIAYSNARRRPRTKKSARGRR